MKERASDAERLKKMLLRDDLRLPGGAVEMLKSELIGVVENYFDVEEKTISFSVLPYENGGYVFLLQGLALKAKRVKTII